MIMIGGVGADCSDASPLLNSKKITEENLTLVTTHGVR